MKIEHFPQEYGRLWGGILLFPASFPEYPFRGGQKADGSLPFTENPRTEGRVVKRAELFRIQMARSVRQQVEVGLWRAPPSVRFEFCPIGPNLWALQLQAPRPESLID